jgi:hypothetical protein
VKNSGARLVTGDSEARMCYPFRAPDFTTVYRLVTADSETMIVTLSERPSSSRFIALLLQIVKQGLLLFQSA